MPESLFKVTQMRHSHAPQLLCSEMSGSLPLGVNYDKEKIEVTRMDHSK